MARPDVKSVLGAERAGWVATGMLPVLVLVLWWIPRSATPTEVPGLVVPLAETRAALALDEALAEDAPDTDAERARRTLYLDQGRSEVRANDSVASAAGRAEALILALAALSEESGESAVAAARMADVLRLEAALAGVGSPALRAGEAGMFTASLERWGATEGGRRIAPPITVRALSIARWNAVFTRPLTEGMSPVHLRAYHGWLALHGAVGWTELREAALDRYAATGGARALETRGVLLSDADDPMAAHVAFRQAYDIVGSLRLRNLALGALAAAAEDDEL